jgi:hypothetical protein
MFASVAGVQQILLNFDDPESDVIGERGPSGIEHRISAISRMAPPRSARAPLKRFVAGQPNLVRHCAASAGNAEVERLRERACSEKLAPVCESAAKSPRHRSKGREMAAHH